MHNLVKLYCRLMDAPLRFSNEEQMKSDEFVQKEGLSGHKNARRRKKRRKKEKKIYSLSFVRG